MEGAPASEPASLSHLINSTGLSSYEILASQYDVLARNFLILCVEQTYFSFNFIAISLLLPFHHIIIL